MKTERKLTDANRQQIFKEANAMMKRIILTVVFLLGAVALASAAPMAVPSVTSSETITYEQPKSELPPTNPPRNGPDCSQYPGTVAHGMDCIPIAGNPTNTSTGGGGCLEGQYMRNGICVNRTYAPTPTNVLYPSKVQNALNLVGCLPKYGIDGNWGPGSRSALANFYRHARLSAAGTEPTQVVLSDVQSQRGRICPAVVAPSGPNCSRIKYAYKSGNTCKCEGSRKFNGKYCIKTTTTASTGGGKPKCSKIKYAYTSGNTCKCSGGRSFNGKYCVKTQTTTTQTHSDQASGQTIVDIITAIGDATKKNDGGGYTPKCYKSCNDDGYCETVCE
jgi:hypothetical protein